MHYEEVKLTESELFSAALIGVMRQISSLRQNHRPAYGYEDDAPWQIGIEGACGEMAAAKCLGIFPSLGVDTFKAPDLPGLQIKTRSSHEYDLLVRPHDEGDQKFVLVTGRNGSYRVQGWAYGYEAKQQEYEADYGNRPKAYFMPAEKLRHISELRDLFRAIEITRKV